MQENIPTPDGTTGDPEILNVEESKENPNPVPAPVEQNVVLSRKSTRSRLVGGGWAKYF